MPGKKSKGWYPPYVEYVCITCENPKVPELRGTTYTLEEYAEHLKTVHDFEPQGKTCNMSLVMHVNKKPRHSAIYQGVFEDNGTLQFYKYTG